MPKSIKRRHILGVGAALAVAGKAPAIAKASATTLRFVPNADLSSIDPIAISGYPIRNHGYMVYDTLYATDSEFRIRPQMAQGHEVLPDGLTWTFHLRDGLRFHDGAPVLARDCVASLRRWGARDGVGQALLALTNDLTEIDDRSFRFRLRQPFPLMLDALGKTASPVPFIMPERIAVTPPTTQIRDATGSGPFRFLPDQWVSGSHVGYAKFENYLPRNEPPAGAAGAKIAYVDRVEWHILPDASTASSALRQGEVDWYEQPNLNLLPVLRAAPGIVVNAYYDGFELIMHFNQLQAPFNNPAVRQAVLASIDQSDYLATMVPDPAQSLACKSFFFCGTPSSTGAGSEAMTANLKRGQQLLAASGYAGEKVLIISPTDIEWLANVSLVTDDLLKRLGMNVETVAMDLGTFFARRNSAEPVNKGGWSIFHTGLGSVDLASPAFNFALRGNGRQGWPGWPTDPMLERLRSSWMGAASEAEHKAIAADMERHAFTTIPYIPLGVRRNYTAYRSNITGMQKASAPFAWNIKKS
jgi:peptide/nickel transport system substrate-binding protein